MTNNPILYFDIETAAQTAGYDELSLTQRERWHTSYWRDTPPSEMPDDFRSVIDAEQSGYLEKGALYPEYGRVVCIAWAEDESEVRVSITEDEKETLTAFGRTLAVLDRSVKLCGHNIKAFDVPFLRKRYILNGLPVPQLLRTGNLKPWELPFIDTMELWAGSGKRDFASLELLCDLFNIPQPKTDLTGADVSATFWGYDTPKEQAANYDRISAYCKADVEATRSLHQRLINS